MGISEHDPVAWIARLVAFDTTSRRSNLDLIECVADYLRGFGIASRLTHDDNRGKANLFATLGPEGRSGIILSGHTDVVPVDGQDWDSDPFGIVDRHGRLFGRGTADMKSFLAVVLSLVPEFLARGLKVPVHLAFSYDEEVGCLGVPRLIEEMSRDGLAPALAIIGEPTEMRVVDAHKGIYTFTTTVTGHEAHSSMPHLGVNAIMVGAELIGHLDKLAQELRAAADPGDGFDPPHATLHVGTVGGGTAVNIVPRRCRFAWEYRLLPDHDENILHDRFDEFAAVLEADIRKVAPEAAIVTEAGARVPPLRTRRDSPAAELALALTGENASEKASFGTEAGLFQLAGVDAVVCGPGSIEQAHKPNEFVSRDQVARCAATLRRLMDRVCLRPS